MAKVMAISQSQSLIFKIMTDNLSINKQVGTQIQRDCQVRSRRPCRFAIQTHRTMQTALLHEGIKFVVVCAGKPCASCIIAARFCYAVKFIDCIKNPSIKNRYFVHN